VGCMFLDRGGIDLDVGVDGRMEYLGFVGREIELEPELELVLQLLQ